MPLHYNKSNFKYNRYENTVNYLLYSWFGPFDCILLYHRRNDYMGIRRSRSLVSHSRMRVPVQHPQQTHRSPLSLKNPLGATERFRLTDIDEIETFQLNLADIVFIGIRQQIIHNRKFRGSY